MNYRRLFRGKTENGEWVVGWLLGNHSIIAKNQSVADLCEKCLIPKTTLVDPETIGQCTGLSAPKSYRGDKSDDLLIFENDIVEVYDCNGMLWFVGEVTYSGNGGFMLFRQNRHGIYGSDMDKHSFDFDEYHYKIIGNIHDNPELLQ